jgi:hypothetical protein
MPVSTRAPQRRGLPDAVADAAAEVLEATVPIDSKVVSMFVSFEQATNELPPDRQAPRSFL